ncbi:hypothetical protein PO124_26975 [Bacillus licheniformis]|nr:hypothetical protein [Bacillus licheniformis]
MKPTSRKLNKLEKRQRYKALVVRIRKAISLSIRKTYSSIPHYTVSSASQLQRSQGGKAQELVSLEN